MSKNEQQECNLAQELDAMKRRNQELQSETQTMKAKVICLETEKGDAYMQLKKYKDALIAHRRELSGLQEHLHVKKDLESQIDNHKKQVLELQSDSDRLRELLKDTESDMRKYQNQYQDSMDLIEKLTSNNVDLKIKLTEFSSELDSLNVSHKDLLDKYNSISAQLKTVQKESSILSEQLAVEQTSRKDESTNFQSELTEKDTLIQRMRREAEESQNEKRLTNRMYNATLKDLKRQLSATTKTHNGLLLDNGKGDHDLSDQTSLRSRASSSSSLEHSPILLHGSASCHALSANTEEPFIPSPQVGDMIDRSVLIDKILKLQRELARKDEKLDFFEDHIALLTSELRKRPK